MPAATLYNKNSANNRLMQGAILNITQNSDKTISFRYRAGKDPVVDAIRTVSTTPSSTICRLDGRPVKNADATSLRHGIYVINGKKVVR
jgi:hypothetical protein